MNWYGVIPAACAAWATCACMSPGNWIGPTGKFKICWTSWTSEISRCTSGGCATYASASPCCNRYYLLFSSIDFIIQSGILSCFWRQSEQQRQYPPRFCVPELKSFLIVIPCLQPEYWRITTVVPSLVGLRKAKPRGGKQSRGGEKLTGGSWWRNSTRFTVAPAAVTKSKSAANLSTAIALSLLS